jgi:preprotein translocase subunit SecG
MVGARAQNTAQASAGSGSCRPPGKAPAAFGTIQRAMRRLLATLTSSIVLLLLLAPAALAANDGRGFYGATNDKLVTKVGFILVAFFAIFVFAMSMLLKRLDKRKEARKAAQKAHVGNAQWRGGW